MTRQHSDDIAHVSLLSDDDVLARVREVVEGAYRQQLWLMFLDSEQRQLPIVIPHDVPRAPDLEAQREFPGFLGMLIDDLGASAVIVVLERSGSDDLRPSDRAWFSTLDHACERVGVRLRGPILCSEDGFRWIAAEDYLAAGTE